MSMHIQIEIDGKTLRDLVLKHIQQMFNNYELTGEDIHIEVKSEQNYNSEWESAEFRAKMNKHVGT